MATQIKLILPLYIEIPRKTKKDKKWILNMNNYRNTHYRVCNEAKIAYSKLIAELVDEVYKFEKCKLEFKYFHKNKGRVDKSNPCSVIEKFACDALTELGFWDDDDSSRIPETLYLWGGVSPENPRCELTITEII